MANTYIGKSSNSRRLMEIIEIAEKSGASPILWGEPGVGKTQLIKNLAFRRALELNNIDPDSEKAHTVDVDELPEQYPLVILIGATIEPTELLGLPALEKITTSSGKEVTVTKNTMPDWLFKLTEAGRGILFLDELNSAPPSVQAAELSLLQGRLVGQYKIPDDVLIIAAANPLDIAANGWSLPAPLANRLLHIDIIPDEDDFLEGYKLGWGERLEKMEKGLRESISDFLDKNRTLIQTKPENDLEAGGAWASRRSWDNAVKSMALTKDILTQELILTGWVGIEASQAYFAFRAADPLPSIEEILTLETEKVENIPLDGIEMLIKEAINKVDKNSIQMYIDFFKKLVDSGKGDLVQSNYSTFMKKVDTIDNTFSKIKLMEVHERNHTDTKYLN